MAERFNCVLRRGLPGVASLVSSTSSALPCEPSSLQLAAASARILSAPASSVSSRSPAFPPSPLPGASGGSSPCSSLSPPESLRGLSSRRLASSLSSSPQLGPVLSASTGFPSNSRRSPHACPGTSRLPVLPLAIQSKGLGVSFSSRRLVPPVSSSATPSSAVSFSTRSPLCGVGCRALSSPPCGGLSAGSLSPFVSVSARLSSLSAHREERETPAEEVRGDAGGRCRQTSTTSAPSRPLPLWLRSLAPPQFCLEAEHGRSGAKADDATEENRQPSSPSEERNSVASRTQKAGAGQPRVERGSRRSLSEHFHLWGVAPEADRARTAETGRWGEQGELSFWEKGTANEIVGWGREAELGPEGDEREGGATSGGGDDLFLKAVEGEEDEQRPEGGAETLTELTEGSHRKAAKKREGSRETDEVKKLTFIASPKNELIKHIVRLKRRSDLGRRYESVVVMGLPLVRFMCSPEFRRFASRQGGEVCLPASESRQQESCVAEEADGADARDSGIERETVDLSQGEDGKKQGDVPLKFELLLTDNPAIAGLPSAFHLHARETRCTYSEVMEFLMARRPLEFLPKKEKLGKRKEDRGGCAGKGKDSLLLKRRDVHGFGFPSSSPEDAAGAEMLQPGMSVKTGSKQVVGILKRPRESFDFGPAKCILALGGVRYVWNVGILVRTAAALGFDGVYYVDGTADPFNWKVMEISRGLHYNLPHFHGSVENLLRMCEESDLLPIAADTTGERPEAFQGAVTKHRGICCILGNESHGLSELILQRCRRVALPMSSLLDSLNVGIAGGIVMYEMKKILAMGAGESDTSRGAGNCRFSSESENGNLKGSQLVAVGP
ncbi:RNA methyltransferase, TrmH family protein [Toxoplasma gondii TgCatPRC2]|uniref:RNA methyltransferase, TrmH family protein n=9 Tax=Toxoplasma gondii TaxID=5811 RepID=B9Q0H3_TOXGV|nr:RNA methyltransferase, TrmH family protein [Toxoplasma gondii ME49]EPR58702.1 RNA methyltransferase, TrmH family protein [Toxoplasma gondii GT1]ESS28711.1 RNA methyltransferase, TrmH family protein [Toxoplasma gondii VEG]KAF4639849.1 RNA methyltransferase, TrmH family protein [Toxoplasma gondii]KFG32512.1 RNA methyltransferase, TrmH family protein [Toxoplasma gondii GAB2-2007-GAL-DOM2]KFG40946.1 RNA methyltransferase, TrmH family protein [Toxoplasma gondii FOU]KYF39210.1 RNA methyltransfer|eukprot:XP_002370949.1 RNA methyltransferase, TrmH family protein [Toxoplasma gondii ME49]